MTQLLLVLVFVAGLTSCISNGPKANDTADLHMQIATSHIKNGNYPLALKELLLAEEQDPKNARVQANLGLVYFMRERYELSEKHYKNALKLDPEFTEAKNSLARSYIEIDKLKEAEPLLKEVLADLTYVGFPQANANYGILEFKRKNYSQAAAYFRKSLQHDRENCHTQVFLGRSYLEQGNLTLALPQLEKAIPFCRDINADEAHYYSAIALYRDNQKLKARYRFEELTKLFPSGRNFEKAQKMLALVKKETP